MITGSSRESDAAVPDENKGQSVIAEEDRCDLDPRKKCDNCFRCLETDAMDKNGYARIPISAVYLEDDIWRPD